MTTTVTTEGITAQDLLAACPLVPAVVLDRAEDAHPLGEATLAGGVTAVEPPCAPRPGWKPSADWPIGPTCWSVRAPW
jgi:hypothetical protein